jgi:Tol biopolymer transport system component
VLAAVLAVSVGAACTPPERTITTAMPPPTSPPASVAPGATVVPPAPLPDPPASASTLPGALLVRTVGGGLAVLRPDGTHLTRIVPEGPDVQVITAAWAPDGSRIAWSQLGVVGGVPSSRVVWSAPDGTHRQEALLSFAAFYLSWDPTGSRVAFLGGEGPLTLGIMERHDGETAGRPLAQGAPFYFSWAPDGDRMITHVADAGLDTLDMEGRERVVAARTGEFQAPAWTSDGTTVVYAAADGQLVARDLQSGRVRDLATLDGGAFLVVSPDGARVAFHARGPEEMDLYDQDLPSIATDMGVHVVGIDGGAEQVVTDVPAMSWSWSPDGRFLAILEPVYLGDDGVRFRWVVWDGHRSFTTEPFVATVASQSEAPFFSQYAQSTSMWSPDGSAFAFAAELPDGTPAIWVQPARRGAEPYPVAPGLTVAWAPAA